MTWIQAFLALLGGGLVSAAANLLGARVQEREAGDNEAARLRAELRGDLDRMRAELETAAVASREQAVQIREQRAELQRQVERIDQLEQLLKNERRDNEKLQAEVERLTLTNGQLSEKVRRLTQEVNRMRSEAGLPPITPDDL